MLRKVMLFLAIVCFAVSSMAAYAAEGIQKRN